MGYRCLCHSVAWAPLSGLDGYVRGVQQHAKGMSLQAARQLAFFSDGSTEDFFGQKDIGFLKQKDKRDKGTKRFWIGGTGVFYTEVTKVFGVFWCWTWI